MPSQYCFLCASDEGVFLDITADNKQIYHEQFEICSLVKVPTTDQLPTKICHKCVYELNQCTSFLQKYNRSIKHKVQTRKNCCSLCYRHTKKEYIFDISKDKNFQHSFLDKIRDVFKNDLGKLQKNHQFVCLTCRYTVDLLLDLKNVSQEIATKLNDIISEEIDYLNFPKIKTTVINRKTTTTESARIATDAEDAEESDKMTRTRSQDNRLANNKSSEKPAQSSSNIKADSNAYKIQKTDEIVCKGFWTSIKSTNVNKQQSVAETKTCKVFLKDVLKVTALKEQKLHQAEEKDQQKKASAVTAKPSTVESKSRKAATEEENETGKQAQKRSAKSSKIDSTDVKELPAKRLRSSAKQVTSDLKVAVSETASQKLKPPEQEDAAPKSGQSYTSDSTATSNRTLTRHKRTTGASLSDADVDSRRERKKLKAILAGNTAIKNMDINGVSSNEDAPPKKKRLRFTSASPVTIDLTKSDKGEESDNKPVAARKGKVKTRKLGRPFRASKTAQKAKSSESDNKESADEEAKLYICKECGTNYENKLVGLTHQLTHYKQPKLALEKRVIDNVEKETVNASEAVDDQCEDQTETIAIRVDDDEEETAGNVSNLDGSDRLEVSGDAEEKAPSPKKEGKERMVEEEKVNEAVEAEEVKEAVEAEEVKETVVAEEMKDAIEAEEVNETIESEEVEETVEAEEVKETEEEEETTKEKEAKDIQETMDTKEVDTKETKDAKENAADVELVVIEHTGNEPDQAEEPEEEKESGSVEIIATPSPSRGRKRGARKSGARWSRARKSSTRRSGNRSNVSDKSDTENVSEITIEEPTSIEQAKDVSRTQIEDITEEIKTEEQAEEGEEGSLKTVEEPEEDKKVDKEEEIPKESKDKDKEEKVVCTEQDSEPVDKESMNGLKPSADVNEVITLVDDEETPEPKEDEQNGVEEEDAQSVTEMKPEDASDKAEDTEKAKSSKRTRSIESCEENKENEEEQSVQANGDAPVTSSEAPLEDADVLIDSEAPCEKDAEKAEDGASESKTLKPEKPTRESANVAAEILEEVLELTSEEIQKRQDVIDVDINNDSVDTETLENISREIQNCVDMPSLKIDNANTGNDSE